jgi:hypothetical protein
MEINSSTNFNSASNFQSSIGFDNGFNASSLASGNQSSFGGIDIQKLASSLIEAVLTGNFSPELIKDLAKLLSPVEIGQLLSAIQKLLVGEGTQGNSPASENANTGETQSGNSPSNAGEIGNGNKSTSNAGETQTGNKTTPTASAPTSTSTPQAPTSSTRITTRAPDSANIRSVENIANDPVVAAAIEKAWNASNPNTPGSKQEQGFWVMRDNKTGALSTVNFPSNGKRDSLTPGAVPNIEGKTAVAFFHTHPNTAAEGYTNGPSTADQKFADARGIPGIIQSHNGLYFFNPNR